eukprot:COSAG01_NODE_49269_length_373_cov_1.835766_1_plen_21_part_10
MLSIWTRYPRAAADAVGRGRV